MKNFKIFIFVIIIGSFSSGLLVFVDKLTEEKIRKNMAFKIKSAILSSLSIPFSKENIDKVFGENIEEISKNGIKYFVTKEKEVAFIFSGNGLWGPISGVISIKNDHKTIKNIVIVHQEETPGLGGRISEEEFLKRFEGKLIIPEIKIVPPGKAEKENEVDGITGATGTIRAFEKILNDTIKRYLKYLED
ncbi:MAG: FMN-binding protein [Candidatus Ratteibacteria bacterium]